MAQKKTCAESALTCLDCDKDEKHCQCPVDPPVRAVIPPMPELPDDDGSEIWPEETEK